MIGRRVTVPWRLGEYAVPANTPVLMSILLLHHRADLSPAVASTSWPPTPSPSTPCTATSR